ncbi:MAG: hypothetical protein E7645_08035 [Ruminococcaceae bacterium]|nr:hypothetical protein [Oscillospiraceae bacterium]
MKKNIIKLLAVILMLCCVLPLASCDQQKPPLDIDAVEENLKAAGYEVHITVDGQTAGIKESLYAVDGNGNTLSLIVCEKASSAKLYFEIIMLGHEQELEELQYNIQRYRHLLKIHEEEGSEEPLKAMEKNLAQAESDLEKKKKEASIGRSGNVVWFGTKDAVETSKTPEKYTETENDTENNSGAAFFEPR